MRALRKQLRKSHEEALAGQRQVSELQDEALRLSETNRKLERVVGKKMLLERERLTERLQKMSGEMAEKERRIMVYKDLTCRITQHLLGGLLDLIYRHI